MHKQTAPPSATYPGGLRDPQQRVRGPGWESLPQGVLCVGQDRETVRASGPRCVTSRAVREEISVDGPGWERLPESETLRRTAENLRAEETVQVGDIGQEGPLQ